MTDLKIEASAYEDPLLKQLRKQVEGCSDQYPVLMLPVRLETRFRKVSRYLTVVNQNINRYNDLLNVLWKVIYDLRLANRTQEKQNDATLKKALESALKELSKCQDLSKKIKELEAGDKDIILDVLSDLNSELRSKLFSKFDFPKKVLGDITKVYNELITTAKSIPAPAESPSESGTNALKELIKLDEAMASIYGDNPIPAFELDNALKVIENAMLNFSTIVENPKFLAKEFTIDQIQSKISHIKRSHKKSPVLLNNFKKTYTGKRDLVSSELLLRKQINDLKSRIDDDYVPYMRLLEKLKQYPVKHLIHFVRKCSVKLKAVNTAGFANAAALLNEREDLYRHMRKIREVAHQPLQGTMVEISNLKAEYDKLDFELEKLKSWTKKVKPESRAQKVGLSRLWTHLSHEYLEDLRNLKTNEKATESQVFSNEKVRHTAAAFNTTINNLLKSSEIIRNINEPAEKAMLAANKQIGELTKNIRISSSNTFLLPRGIYIETISSFQSLVSQISNFYSRNNVSQKHYLRKTIQAQLDSIHESLKNQFTDIFDERDFFYDDFRKRITFIVKSETVNELWVRIYPDDIAIDNHDERLTESELNVGKAYYNEIYSLPEHERESMKLPAWRAAATAIGPRRAAYVIKILDEKRTLTAKVKDPLNHLPPVLKALRIAYRVVRHSWNPTHESTYSSFVRGLPETLQNTLAQEFFTPCIRTKVDLEKLSLVIQNTLTLYESIVEEGYGTIDEEAIQSEYKALEFSRELILEYYKNNVHALNTPFDPELNFPKVEMKTKEWDRAGISSVMPDRFVVVTKRGDEVRQIVVGRPVSPNLNVGVDPDTDEEEGFYHLPNGDLQIPDKLRWMFDFDAAVEAGMGVRVPIRDEDFKEGFTFVMAYGVRTHEDLDPKDRPAAGQALLDDLLKSHIYSDGGLEYLPVGTATNNTDAVKSPYTTLDDDIDGMFKSFIQQQHTHGDLLYTDNNELAISDGQFFRDALGIPDTLAALIRNHEKQDITESRAMSRLLHGSTIGYYLRFMLSNLMTDNDMDQVIPFMMKHLSAVGTLPSFRIDKQPYGIMPITLHRKLWVDEPTIKGTFGSFIQKLSMFLNATRKVYEQELVKKVDTINSPSYNADPQKVFLEILGLDPYSKQYIYREGTNIAGRWGAIDTVGDDKLVEWSNKFAVDPTKVSTHYEYLLKKLGYDTPIMRVRAMLKTRTYGARYVNSNDIIGFSVQDPKDGVGKLKKHTLAGGLSQNYLEWLNTLSSDSMNLFRIRTEDVIQNKFNTVLFELARIALMYDNRSPAHRAVTKLVDLDVPVLERLMAGHLDLCSYRLDAWLTGLADYRLSELRRSNPNGIFIGAYGFVENLKEAHAKKQVQIFPEGLEPDDGTRVDIMPDNQGFIHGPSLNHAVTAAVLRAGYTSQKNNEINNNNIFGINLSSSRIRKALHMLEGAVRGQETGALLGYQFERALHENYKDTSGKHLEMDVQIYRLRKKFPTYSDKFISGTDTKQEESIKALNVVDGLALLDYMEKFILKNLYWDDEMTFEDMLIRQIGGVLEFPGYPYGLDKEMPSIKADEGPNVVAINRQKARAIIHALDLMADSLDAMGDLITAEGVYQLVRGNHTRANAVLSAMSEGRIPADPEIIRNMREGNMVTQRVILAIDPADAPTPWDIIPQSPRSMAEPALNRWVASQLGDPGTVGWRVTSGSDINFYTLINLGMQPLDLVILVGSGEEGLAELELRAARVAYQDGASPDDDIRIDFYQSSTVGSTSLGEQLALIQQLGKICVKARAADGRDFRLPEEDESFGMVAPSVDTDDLFTRLQDAANGYASMLESLSLFLPGIQITPQILAKGVERSIELTGWGFNGHYPNIKTLSDETDLLNRILTAKEKMKRNLQKATSLLADLALEPEQVKWMDTSREIGELFFGTGFRILPKLKLNHAEEMRLRMDQPKAGGILRNIVETDLESWLSDLAMVRKNLAPIDTLRMLTEVCDGRKIPFSVIQMPHLSKADGSTDEYWLGAPYPESWQPEGDKLSLVIFGHQNLGDTTCAMVFDEWTEIIPSGNRTSGIALHYNQPDARPPQALMMAVSPDVTGAWSIDDLGLIVEEAFNMAKIRAVEPDQFDNTILAQLLPATTLLSGGETDGVAGMLHLNASLAAQPQAGMKGALATLSDINTDIDKTEI